MHCCEYIAPAAVLTFPRLTAIGGMNNHTAFPDRPSLFIRNKKDIADIIPDFGVNFGPRSSAILAHGDCSALSDSNGTIGVRKLNVLQVVGGRATDHVPSRTSIRRTQDAAVPTDCPGFVRRRKLDAG